ncbi:MAG: MarC family protein [Puniceicoccales bacterium]|jgi:multiple antibiotic resistance protein|nr:MarC family protein [Puniceicoccales bacterium]
MAIFVEIIFNFIKLLVMSAPACATPVFLALTHGQTLRQRVRVALIASCVAEGILIAFALVGPSIFQFFGISLQAFKIAGGLYLTYISVSLMMDSGEQSADGEQGSKAQPSTGIAITPLGVPLICGPGMISLTLLLGCNDPSLVGRLSLCVSIFCTFILFFLILWIAARYAEKINMEVLKIAKKLTGVFIAAIGTLIFLGGVSTFLQKGTIF